MTLRELLIATGAIVPPPVPEDPHGPTLHHPRWRATLDAMPFLAMDAIGRKAADFEVTEGRATRRAASWGARDARLAARGVFL